MIRTLFLSLPVLLALLLSACQSPGPGGGGGGLRLGGSHNEYGDRAGPRGFREVIIDAGHGGKDDGAKSRITGAREKNVALDIAKRVQSALGSSFRTSMTRRSDVFVPLDDRVAIANRGGDAILVSIHLNDGPRSLRGPETYWWRVDSYSLATRVQAQLRAVAGSGNNRGQVRRRLRLTRNPDIPCILVECGYLSNATEANKLSESSYRERLAQAIAAAIREQAACGDVGVGALPKPIYAAPSTAHDARGS